MTKRQIEIEKEVKRILQYEPCTFDEKCKRIAELIDREMEE